MNTRTQLRGHCQLCARLWAVPDGRMSKHGYTVKDGWFQGVCPGMNYAPLEVSREQADQFIKSLREQAPELRQRAEDYEAGRITPMECSAGWDAKNGKVKRVPWLEANASQQRSEVQSLVWRLKRRAELAVDTANTIEALADKVHGVPVIKVEILGGPPPIRSGEVRQADGGRALTCKYTEKGRVYYSWVRDDGKQLTTWMGTQSWRKLSLVTATEKA